MVVVGVLKAHTPQLNALKKEEEKNKHTHTKNTHIMYIEMENAIRNLTKANT